MSSNGEIRPHFKDFFLYIIIIIIALVAVVFLFSKNYSKENTSDNVEVIPATSSATPIFTPVAKQK